MGKNVNIENIEEVEVTMTVEDTPVGPSKKEEAKGLPLFCYLFSLSRMFLEAQRFIAGIERTQTRTVRISAAGWEA